MARLYVPRFHKLQHTILQLAWDKPEMQEGQITGPTINELVDLTGATESQVLRAVQYLKERGFVHNGPKTNVVSSPTGEVALRKEDILEEGWEKFKANLLRWVQIIGIASGAVIGVATFIINVVTTNKNKVELELLKREVQTLKQKRVSVPASSARIEARPPVRDSIRIPSSFGRQDARPEGKRGSPTK